MNGKINIAVLVSGGGTNLQALIDAEKSGIIKSGSIKLVISNKAGAFALERAVKAGIDSAVIEKTCRGYDSGFEGSVLDLLEKNSIDMIVLAGFMCILSPEFISEYRNRIINVHPALIPSFCGKGYYGLKVHEEALRYGVKITGATVHYVNEVPDGGEIIFQKAVEVREGDTPETLQKRVMEEAEWILLPRAAEIVAQRIGKEKFNGCI